MFMSVALAAGIGAAAAAPVLLGGMLLTEITLNDEKPGIADNISINL